VGPLISAPQEAAVLESSDGGARAEGAHVRTGARPAGRGFFVAPTVLDGVAPSAAAARHEIFGPVASVITFDDEAEAAALADATDFGLFAGIWTQDVGRAVRLVKQIRAGQVFVNTYGVGGGVELPFGGYKRSGFGRVKGMAGALEYTQVKNVCIYSG
jgi:acyl-CoA reductase-like NAD-dependent aldehyde dehydrogenase